MIWFSGHRIRWGSVVALVRVSSPLAWHRAAHGRHVHTSSVVSDFVVDCAGPMVGLNIRLVDFIDSAVEYLRSMLKQDSLKNDEPSGFIQVKGEWDVVRSWR